MAPKHTPGPWLAMRGVDATDQYAIIGGGHFIARLDPHANREANARLIAAAPELYHLLKEAVDEMNSGDEPGAGFPWHLAASEALAKAEGLS